MTSYHTYIHIYLPSYHIIDQLTKDTNTSLAYMVSKPDPIKRRKETVFKAYISNSCFFEGFIACFLFVSFLLLEWNGIWKGRALKNLLLRRVWRGGELSPSRLRREGSSRAPLPAAESSMCVCMYVCMYCMYVCYGSMALVRFEPKVFLYVCTYVKVVWPWWGLNPKSFFFFSLSLGENTLLY